MELPFVIFCIVNVELSVGVMNLEIDFTIAGGVYLVDFVLLKRQLEVQKVKFQNILLEDPT